MNIVTVIHYMIIIHSVQFKMLSIYFEKPINYVLSLNISQKFPQIVFETVPMFV